MSKTSNYSSFNHVIELHTNPGIQVCQYIIAGRLLLSNSALEPLTAYKADTNNTPVMDEPEDAPNRYNVSSHWLAERFWICNQWRRVAVSHSTNGCQLAIEEIGQYRIDRGGSQIALVHAENGASESQLQEVAIGPVLLLALAMQNTWSLHTSAVLDDGSAILILGDSGAGKSTLASFLASTIDNVELVADDILPFEVRDNCLIALPHYPQLKYPLDAQPGVQLAEEVPIRSIVALSKLESPEDTIQCRELSLSERVQTLVHHSVATRLFDEVLMQRHLAEMAKAATITPVMKIDYPHTKEARHEVQQIALGL